MTQKKISYTAYPEGSAQLDISIVLESGLVGCLACGVYPERAPVAFLMSFMSFWDRFRRKPKDEDRSEDEGQKKTGCRWRVFHRGGHGGGGHGGGGTGKSHSTGKIHHSHHGGIGRTGHGGGISG